MAPQFRRILCPVDFDDNSMQALDTAANLARESNGTVFVLHVVPIIIEPTGMPVYVDLYKGQEETARAKLLEIAHKRLGEIKYELLIHTRRARRLDPERREENRRRRDRNGHSWATRFQALPAGQHRRSGTARIDLPCVDGAMYSNSKRPGRDLDDKEPRHCDPP